MTQRSNLSTSQVDAFEGRTSPEDRSFSRILQEILDHLTEIIRSEVRLARTEVRQDVSGVAKASVFFVIGSAFGLYALGFLLLGGVYALSTRLPLWLSAVIVGATAALIAALFFQVGTKKIKRTSLRPDKTIQSFQENAAWITKQTR